MVIGNAASDALSGLAGIVGRTQLAIIAGHVVEPILGDAFPRDEGAHVFSAWILVRRTDHRRAPNAFAKCVAGLYAVAGIAIVARLRIARGGIAGAIAIELYIAV
ncbi:MAG: hypothetical protein U1F43_16645 [Myxococcota bacterium]